MKAGKPRIRPVALFTTGARRCWNRKILKQLLFLYFVVNGASASDYPNMEGVWDGRVRTVSSGEQVQTQVARGGAVIQNIELRLKVSYQYQEVFIGETSSNTPDSQPVSVWGAIRSTGKEGVFVTGDGGRGNIWFTTPSQFEFCFTNQTPTMMNAYCAVLDKQ